MDDFFDLAFSGELSLINESFYSSSVSQSEMDKLLAQSWRHFGQHFFRYNFGIFRGEIRRVIPLRIRLGGFSLSKSQRSIIKTNGDLQTVFRPIKITSEAEHLFTQHKLRFKEGIPDSVFDFLDRDAAKTPTTAFECAVYRKDQLIAVSYFDVGARSVSSIYAMFDPDEARRSLGIYTLLLEADFAVRQKKTFHYLGYAYEGNSFYDYKKRFRSLECFDWSGNWQDFKNID